MRAKRTEPIFVNCEQCGVSFKTHQRRTARFCNRACADLFRHGSNHPGWKGGALSSQGYWTIVVDGKRVLAHRHIMEEHVGRKLLPTEHVHHINGDKLDNRLENLKLASSLKEHFLEHSGYRSDTEKQCSLCKAIKPRSEFSRVTSKHSAKFDPHHSYCKPCFKAHYPRRH